MLVLQRKPGESIIIDDRIEVTVVSLGPGRVKLGVTCPKEIPVHRKEVAERMKAAEKAAAETAALG